MSKKAKRWWMLVLILVVTLLAVIASAHIRVRHPDLAEAIQPWLEGAQIGSNLSCAVCMMAMLLGMHLETRGKDVDFPLGKIYVAGSVVGIWARGAFGWGYLLPGISTLIAALLASWFICKVQEV